MTNQSLRHRFNIADKNYPMVSRIIKRALENGSIKIDSSNRNGRQTGYIPCWANKQ